MVACHFFNEPFFVLLHITRYVTFARYLCREQHLHHSVTGPPILFPIASIQPEVNSPDIRCRGGTSFKVTAAHEGDTPKGVVRCILWFLIFKRIFMIHCK